jgi:predicted N-formylglutamate amidohydrolase
MKAAAQVNSGMAAFAAFEAMPGALDSGTLIICDHASNTIPPVYGTLGLPPEALYRHIAYDIGAAEVTRALAAQLNAPAVLSTYSRLLIDPNRGLDDPTLVMRYSDGAIVPGNGYIDAAEIAHRSAILGAVSAGGRGDG